MNTRNDVEILRELTPFQKEGLATRIDAIREAFENLEKANKDLEKAKKDYEDAKKFITGGVPGLGVDVKRGVVVRKVEQPND